MQILGDIWAFACGVVRRFYFWLWAFLFDPLDLYNKYIRHFFKQGEIDMPSEAFPYVLGAGLFWAAFMTYREERRRASNLEENRNAPELRPLEWDRLTATQARQISLAIKDWPVRNEVLVACESSDCALLAQDFVKIFRDLGWPTKSGSGGFDGSGADGIVIHPQDSFSAVLKIAIENATGWEVFFSGVPRETMRPPTNQTMLIIGRKPL